MPGHETVESILKTLPSEATVAAFERAEIKNSPFGGVSFLCKVMGGGKEVTGILVMDNYDLGKGELNFPISMARAGKLGLGEAWERNGQILGIGPFKDVFERLGLNYDEQSKGLRFSGAGSCDNYKYYIERQDCEEGGKYFISHLVQRLSLDQELAKGKAVHQAGVVLSAQKLIEFLQDKLNLKIELMTAKNPTEVNTAVMADLEKKLHLE